MTQETGITKEFDDIQRVDGELLNYKTFLEDFMVRYLEVKLFQAFV